MLDFISLFVHHKGILMDHINDTCRRYPRTLFAADAAFPRSPEYGCPVQGPFRRSFLSRFWVRLFCWL